MELLSQPLNGQLGTRLIDLLNSGQFHALNIVVAFAKNSGVLRIKPALQNFRAGGGKVHVIVGVDLGGTSYEALTSLLRNTDSLAVVHAEKNQTFHPKIYHLEGKSENVLIVGSNNLTGGGLWTNFESSLICKTTGPNGSSATAEKQFGDYRTILAGLKGSYLSVGDQVDIDTLLSSGYVLKEVDAQVRLANASKKGGGAKRLFGSGVPASIPQLSAPKSKSLPNPTPPPANPAPKAFPGAMLDWQTIWFETRSMTGGSRNILDLSAKSLVSRGDPTGTPFDLGDPKFMRGSVAFFGLNPSIAGQAKDIVLNFDGIDYHENTILFPSGARANGTWRLQIKGRSSAGQKITDAFRLKDPGSYLVNKIAAFTKIDDSYYMLSVFHDAELSRFESASKILGNNGITSTAKRVGLL